MAQESSAVHKDEFSIDASQTPLLDDSQRRIQELCSIKIEYDFMFKDKDGNDDQQWISVYGPPSNVKKAKEYIKSLCNPVEKTTLRFPPEMKVALSDSRVWNKMEKDSHAVIFFPADDTIQIHGADSLSVTLAMSALEDIISKFGGFSPLPSPAGGGAAAAAGLGRQNSASSRRLDDELRRLSAGQGSIIAPDDAELLSMNDQVKRAILLTSQDVETPRSPSDFSRHGGFVDLRDNPTESASLPVALHPPDFYALPDLSLAESQRDKHTDYISAHRRRDTRPDYLHGGRNARANPLDQPVEADPFPVMPVSPIRTVATVTYPSEDDLDLNRLAVQGAESDHVVREPNFTDRTELLVVTQPDYIAIRGETDDVYNVTRPADDGFDVALLEMLGLSESSEKDDPVLWTFALDQGFSKTEIDKVLKTFPGAAVKTADLFQTLSKNRTGKKGQKKKSPAAPPSSQLSPIYHENGFPKKLPVPPAADELQTSPVMKRKHVTAGNHGNYPGAADTSLPSDYLQLWEEEGIILTGSKEELKARNAERRKILEAAINAEPEVTLSSKPAVTLSSKTNDQGGKKTGKNAKKKDKKKKKGANANNQPLIIKSVTSRKTATPEPSSEEEDTEATPNVVVENAYEVLLSDEESSRESPERKATTSPSRSRSSQSPPRGTTSTPPGGEVRTSTPSRGQQPAFIPASVEFRKWGALKEDSMCRTEAPPAAAAVEKEPDSMPWTLASKKPKQRAHEPGSSSPSSGKSHRPQVTLHTKSDKRSAALPDTTAGHLLQAAPVVHSHTTAPGYQQGAALYQQAPAYRGSQGRAQSPRANSPKRANSPRVRAGQGQGKHAPPGQARHIPGMPPPTIPLRSKLRYIVIDGSNVAMSHGNGRVFSCKGIQLCVDYFLQRGHTEITVFIPQWRTRQPTEHNPMSDQEIIFDLKQKGFLTLTPARRVQGKNIVCYDDRFVVKLAETTDGIIVSNDNYRDLWREKVEWREIIENRLLMYSFVADIFMVPDDPLGQDGPTLDAYLTKPHGDRLVTYFPTTSNPQPSNGLQGNQGAGNHHGNGYGMYQGTGAPPGVYNGAAQNQQYRGPPPVHNTAVRPLMPPGGVTYARPPGNYRPQGGATNPRPQGGAANTRPQGGSTKPRPLGANGGNHNNRNSTPPGVASSIEITEWGGAATHTTAPSPAGKKAATRGQHGSKTRTGARSPTQTIALYKQLLDVFPGNGEKITNILDNHAGETDVVKLTNYLLEVLY